jgi:hypothetical protein
MFSLEGKISQYWNNVNLKKPNPQEKIGRIAGGLDERAGPWTPNPGPCTL